MVPIDVLVNRQQNKLIFKICLNLELKEISNLNTNFIFWNHNAFNLEFKLILCISSSLPNLQYPLILI